MTALAVPQEDMFDAVRCGFAAVARMARHVKINHGALADYATKLPDRPRGNVFDKTHHFTGGATATAAYVLTLDAINFGSGYEPHMAAEGWQRIDHSLYFSLSTRLKQYFEARGVISAPALARIDAEALAEILMLPDGHYSHEFAGLCVASLQELGHEITDNYGGDFLGFVEAAQGSAERLVRRLASMHKFNDIHLYRGLHIPFYKRAQITVADLHLAFGHLGQSLIRDIDRLTMFADNGVPHVLRVDGVLEYSSELAARIARGEELASGSEEEIEIRACAGQAVELLAGIKKMRAMDIDHILWHRSAEDLRYREKPTHRTLSVYY